MNVSVIIPVYNAAATIGESIESAVKQMEEEDEILVVNNRSSDASVAKIREFQSQYPSRIRLVDEPIQGASAARNRGLKEAKGDWIQFLDADDILLPGKLQQQRLLISDEVDWIMGAYFIEKESGLRELIPLKEDYWLALIFNGGVGHLGSGLFCRSMLLQEGGFTTSLPDGEDLDLYFRLLKSNCKFIKSENPAYVYRDLPVPHRLTKSDAKGMADRQVNFTKRVISYLKRNNQSYYRQHKGELNTALLGAINRQIRVDSRKASANFKACFPEGFKSADFSADMLPNYSYLYRVFGFISVESCRSCLGEGVKLLYSYFK